MTSPLDLIKAIRTGRLADVVAALDAGASVELNDGQGEPGLPLAIACFMGFPEIVRELIIRGAKINFPDNRTPASPLSMALRGGQTEVVKVLIEFGAEVPPDTPTGLSDQELKLARWKAQHFGTATSGSAIRSPLEIVEEIQLTGGCYGTDTAVLEAEVLRTARNMSPKKN